MIHIRIEAGEIGARRPFGAAVTRHMRAHGEVGFTRGVCQAADASGAITSMPGPTTHWAQFTASPNDAAEILAALARDIADATQAEREERVAALEREVSAQRARRHVESEYDEGAEDA